MTSSEEESSTSDVESDVESDDSDVSSVTSSTGSSSIDGDDLSTDSGGDSGVESSGSESKKSEDELSPTASTDNLTSTEDVRSQKSDEMGSEPMDDSGQITALKDNVGHDVGAEEVANEDGLCDDDEEPRVTVFHNSLVVPFGPSEGDEDTGSSGILVKEQYAPEHNCSASNEMLMNDLELSKDSFDASRDSTTLELSRDSTRLDVSQNAKRLDLLDKAAQDLSKVASDLSKVTSSPPALSPEEDKLIIEEEQRTESSDSDQEWQTVELPKIDPAKDPVIIDVSPDNVMMKKKSLASRDQLVDRRSNVAPVFNDDLSNSFSQMSLDWEHARKMFQGKKLISPPKLATVFVTEEPQSPPSSTAQSITDVPSTPPRRPNHTPTTPTSSRYSRPSLSESETSELFQNSLLVSPCKQISRTKNKPSRRISLIKLGETCQIDFGKSPSPTTARDMGKKLFSGRKDWEKENTTPVKSRIRLNKWTQGLDKLKGDYLPSYSNTSPSPEKTIDVSEFSIFKQVRAQPDNIPKVQSDNTPLYYNPQDSPVKDPIETKKDDSHLFKTPTKLSRRLRKHSSSLSNTAASPITWSPGKHLMDSSCPYDASETGCYSTTIESSSPLKVSLAPSLDAMPRKVSFAPSPEENSQSCDAFTARPMVSNKNDESWKESVVSVENLFPPSPSSPDHPTIDKPTEPTIIPTHDTFSIEERMKNSKPPPEPSIADAASFIYAPHEETLDFDDMSRECSPGGDRVMIGFSEEFRDEGEILSCSEDEGEYEDCPAHSQDKVYTEVFDKNAPYNKVAEKYNEVSPAMSVDVPLEPVAAVPVPPLPADYLLPPVQANTMTDEALLAMIRTKYQASPALSASDHSGTQAKPGLFPDCSAAQVQSAPDDSTLLAKPAAFPVVITVPAATRSFDFNAAKASLGTVELMTNRVKDQEAVAELKSSPVSEKYSFSSGEMSSGEVSEESIEQAQSTSVLIKNDLPEYKSSSDSGPNAQVTNLEAAETDPTTSQETSAHPGVLASMDELGEITPPSTPITLEPLLERQSTPLNMSASNYGCEDSNDADHASWQNATSFPSLYKDSPLVSRGSPLVSNSSPYRAEKVSDCDVGLDLIRNIMTQVDKSKGDSKKNNLEKHVVSLKDYKKRRQSMETDLSSKEAPEVSLRTTDTPPKPKAPQQSSQAASIRQSEQEHSATPLGGEEVQETMEVDTAGQSDPSQKIKEFGADLIPYNFIPIDVLPREFMYPRRVRIIQAMLRREIIEGAALPHPAIAAPVCNCKHISAEKKMEISVQKTPNVHGKSNSLHQLREAYQEPIIERRIFQEGILQAKESEADLIISAYLAQESQKKASLQTQVVASASSSYVLADKPLASTRPNMSIENILQAKEKESDLMFPTSFAEISQPNNDPVEEDCTSAPQFKENQNPEQTQNSASALTSAKVAFLQSSEELSLSPFDTTVKTPGAKPKSKNKISLKLKKPATTVFHQQDEKISQTSSASVSFLNGLSDSDIPKVKRMTNSFVPDTYIPPNDAETEKVEKIVRKSMSQEASQSQIALFNKDPAFSSEAPLPNLNQLTPTSIVSPQTPQTNKVSSNHLPQPNFHQERQAKISPPPTQHHADSSANVWPQCPTTSQRTEPTEQAHPKKRFRIPKVKKDRTPQPVKDIIEQFLPLHVSPRNSPQTPKTPVPAFVKLDSGKSLDDAVRKIVREPVKNISEVNLPPKTSNEILSVVDISDFTMASLEPQPVIVESGRHQTIFTRRKKEQLDVILIKERKEKAARLEQYRLEEEEKKREGEEREKEDEENKQREKKKGRRERRLDAEERKLEEKEKKLEEKRRKREQFEQKIAEDIIKKKELEEKKEEELNRPATSSAESIENDKKRRKVSSPLKTVDLRDRLKNRGKAKEPSPPTKKQPQLDFNSPLFDARAVLNYKTRSEIITPCAGELPYSTLTEWKEHNDPKMAQLKILTLARIRLRDPDYTPRDTTKLSLTNTLTCKKDAGKVHPVKAATPPLDKGNHGWGKEKKIREVSPFFAPPVNASTAPILPVLSILPPNPLLKVRPTENPLLSKSRPTENPLLLKSRPTEAPMTTKSQQTKKDRVAAPPLWKECLERCDKTHRGKRLRKRNVLDYMIGEILLQFLLFFCYFLTFYFNPTLQVVDLNEIFSEKTTGPLSTLQRALTNNLKVSVVYGFY